MKKRGINFKMDTWDIKQSALKFCSNLYKELDFMIESKWTLSNPYDCDTLRQVVN